MRYLLLNLFIDIKKSFGFTLNFFFLITLLRTLITAIIEGATFEQFPITSQPPGIYVLIVNDYYLVV